MRHRHRHPHGCYPPHHRRHYFDPRDPATRLGRYVSLRLHRRLFLWFGLAILSTGLTVGLVMNIANRTSGESWEKEQQRVTRFVGNQFAASWTIPAQRDALAMAMARDFDMDVSLSDATGDVLSQFGAQCTKPQFTLPVTRDGQRLGTVKFCAQRHFGFSGSRLAVVLFVVMAVLWAISGKIARRLSRPLSELARAARELGNGNLSSRARPMSFHPSEMGILTDVFNDMAARIQKQLADQRELLAGVSHELRTPLARIRILLELIRDGAGPERLDEIDREIMEIDSLVGELLASSRLEFGVTAVKPIAGDELARRALQRAGLSESLLSVSGDTQLQGDPTLIARALANLIDNAKKYGGGLFTLRVEERGDAVVFEVDDAGQGFTDESIQNVFKAFAPPTDGQSREHGSLGLGLSLVKRIAEAHGGRAYVGERPGGGARVGMELRRRRAEQTTAALAT